LAPRCGPLRGSRTPSDALAGAGRSGYAPRLASDLLATTREWRNRQTRTVEGRVPERGWRFKSSLAHFTATRPTRPNTAGSADRPRLESGVFSGRDAAFGRIGSGWCSAVSEDGGGGDLGGGGVVAFEGVGVELHGHRRVGGELLVELPPAVAVEDGEGASVERDGSFAHGCGREGDELLAGPAVVAGVRNGIPVGELRPVRRRFVSRDLLLEVFASAPRIDAAAVGFEVARGVGVRGDPGLPRRRRRLFRCSGSFPIGGGFPLFGGSCCGCTRWSEIGPARSCGPGTAMRGQAAARALSGGEGWAVTSAGRWRVPDAVISE
jgi:hypothetical protein